MDTACEGCGLPLAQDEMFCGNCGYRVSAPGSMPAGGGRSLSAADGFLASAALGQATPNATYLGQRLLYEKEPEASFDPSTNPRFLFQLFRQAGLFVALYLVCALVSYIFFTLVDVGGMGSSAFRLWAICGALSAVILLIVFLLLPVTALLSEWKFLVDDKGEAGPVAFEHIVFALQRRETPLEVVQIRRLRLPGGLTRDYLELRRGIFTGVVSCFPHGEDLYVGWTFWLRLSPLRWLRRPLAGLWYGITQRGSDLYLTLSYEPAKAMRDAMHSAAREGVDVAAGQLAAQGEGLSTAIPVATVNVPV
jgi:hypothetical protein